MDEIQRHVIKWGKRNVISRQYHAKDDKEAIATWRLDLDRIVHVFNVCSVIPARRLLIFGFQIELRANTHASVSDTHQDAGNEHTTGSDATKTHTIVSDIHHNKLKSREGADGQNRAVSTTCTLPATD